LATLRANCSLRTHPLTEHKAGLAASAVFQVFRINQPGVEPILLTLAARTQPTAPLCRFKIKKKLQQCGITRAIRTKFKGNAPVFEVDGLFLLFKLYSYNISALDHSITLNKIKLELFLAVFIFLHSPVGLSVKDSVMGPVPFFPCRPYFVQTRSHELSCPHPKKQKHGRR